MTSSSPSITVFPLSTIKGGDSGIVGFTKIVWELEGVSIVEGGTFPSSVLLVGHF
jgi:hypothetical protein